MAYQKTCPGCGNTFWGSINKLVCSDACRKRCKSRGIDIHAVSTNLEKKSDTPPPSTPQHSGTGRSTGSNSLWSYAGKRLIDVGAHKLKNMNITQKETPPTSPLLVTNFSSINSITGIINQMNKIPLPANYEKFLADLTTPSKILLWGKQGSGKSTYALMLANQFSKHGRVLFVSGEEEPKGKTFQQKWNRTIEAQSNSKIDLINRLPTSTEWTSILYETNGQLKYKFVMYDSIQILKMDPFYIKIMAGKMGREDFTKNMNHIYISYADKEGTTYSGQAAWGHEVDIEVKCEQGKGIIYKNRFATETNGLIGEEFIIY